MGRIIVITSGKGGTGKSSVTSALGAALARRGKEVLLLDCDWGLRCLDLMLGISQEIVYDLGDVLTGSCEISRAVYKSKDTEGLYLMPAPQSADAAPFAERFKKLCEVLSNKFDYLLIDSPAGIESGFKTAVSPAQLALVVVTPDAVCIRDAERVGRMLSSQGVAHHRLIINKFSRSVFKYEETRNLDKVIDGVSMQLIAVVPEDKSVTACSSAGKPLSEKSRAGAAIKRLAQRIEGEDVLVPRRI